MESSLERPVALITGGSRGIGAATAGLLARRGYDVAVTFRNKAARADAVVAQIEAAGGRGLAIGGDITLPSDRDAMAAAVGEWSGRLDLLVLNASGGLERDIVAADPEYPMRINRDAQIAALDVMVPLLEASPNGGVVVFVTSHWAHRYGEVEQLPAYDGVASSKHAGEQALRERIAELAEQRIRLAVVTGDLIEGTITPKLLERVMPGMTGDRRERSGVELPTTDDMAEAIVAAATNRDLASGETMVVGGALDSLPAAR